MKCSTSQIDRVCPTFFLRAVNILPLIYDMAEVWTKRSLPVHAWEDFTPFDSPMAWNENCSSAYLGFPLIFLLFPELVILRDSFKHIITMNHLI